MKLYPGVYKPTWQYTTGPTVMNSVEHTDQSWKYVADTDYTINMVFGFWI